MGAKVLAGVGLFFALVAVILKSVALSVPHFVDVHLVADPANANDDNRLGGVGVFQSEFDSNLQGGIRADIEAANIPIITITTPTTEFPLLFPSQENFFATVLPINADTLQDLDDAVPGAAVTLQAQVEGVANLALNDDDCTTFAGQSQLAVNAFFVNLQTLTIPGAVVAIAAEIPVGANAGFVSAIRLAETVSAQRITVGATGLAFGNAQLVAGVQASPACGNGTITPSADLTISDSANRQCLSALFSQVSNPVLDFVAALVASEAACPDAAALTTAECIGANLNKYVVQDTNLFEVASFEDNLSPSPCEFFFNCTRKLDYLQSLSSFINANVPVEDGGEELSGAISAYVAIATGATNDGVSLVDQAVATFAAGFPRWPTTDVASALFDETDNKGQAYAPCVVLNPLLRLTGDSCTTLEDFLAELPLILEDAGSDLAPTVASISGLYAQFFASNVTGLAPLSVAPGAFTFGLIEAGFNADFESQDLTAEIIAACGDDVEDLEKIGQAQVLAAASTAFEAVAILLIIVGIILPVDKLAYLAPAAAISGILGGIFIMAALFVVRSAPVYDGVGDPGDGVTLEVFFIQGYVPLLALVDAVLFFLSGIILIVATVFACKEGGEASAGHVDDIKADGPMEDKI